MGVSLQKRSSYNGTRRNYQPLSEINVTPFVDVMLVLLIVFMVTAPLLSVGVKVDLPKTHASTLNLKQDPIIVSVSKEGEIFVNNQKTTNDDFLTLLTSFTKDDKEKRVYVRGDENVSYGKVMQIMGLMNSNGYEKVALITKTNKKNK